MKYKNILFILLSFYLFSSCNKPNKSEGNIPYENIPQMKRIKSNPEIINISKAKTISESEFFSKHVSKLNFVQLDNTVPIGTINKMRIYKGKVYALSNDKIYVFNALTGRYLFTIDYKGHGHNEYISLSDFQILPNEKVLLGVDNMELKLFKFALSDGKFISVTKLLVGTAYMRKFGNYYYHYVFYQNDLNDKETWQLVVTNGKKFIAKQFLLNLISKNSDLTDNLYENENNLIFIPEYSDTVYSINKNLTYSIQYVIKQKKSIWQKKDKELSFKELHDCMKENGYTYLLGDQFFQTENGILFQIMEGENIGDVLEPYLYDKLTKNVYKIETGIYMFGVNAIYPDRNYLVSDNTIYGLYNDGNTLKKIVNPKNTRCRKVIENSKEGNNPILVSFKLK